MDSSAIYSLGTEAPFAQAKKRFDEGGKPVGSALVIDSEVIAVDHNRRLQRRESGLGTWVAESSRAFIPQQTSA